MFISTEATDEKDNHLLSILIDRLPGTLFRPWQFLDAAGALKKDDHLISILSGRLLGR
jgi:hypothetical protein